MNKFLKCIVLIFIAYVTVMMFLFPAAFLEQGRASVALCLNVVIPSLFPFFIFSGLFLTLGGARFASRLLSPVMRPLFNLPGAAALCYVLGIISGYPVGASCAADLYSKGECSKTEAERMLAFCNNSGPLFILGSVGAGMLGSPSAGRILYLTHIVSAFAVGLAFRFYNPKLSVKSGKPQLPPSADLPQSVAHSLGSAVSNAITNIFKVCAFVILFSAVTTSLPNFRGAPYIHAALEITGGINKIALLDMSVCSKLSITAMFLAFSGVSVLCQVSSLVSPVGLSLKPYVLGKILQGLIAFFLTAVAVTVFPPETVEVFAQNVPPFGGMPLYRQLAFSLAAAVGWSVISVAALAVTALVIERFKRRKKRR